MASKTTKTAPDGGKSREQYNVAHGRHPKAPLVGGPRQATYDALRTGKGDRIPAAYRK